MKKNRKRRMISVLLVGALLLSGCTGPGKKAQTDSKIVKNAELASDIRTKYEKDSWVDYGDSYGKVDRDEALQFKLGFDMEENDNIVAYSQVLDVFSNEDLTQEVAASYEWDGDEKVLKLNPPRYSLGSIGVNDKLDNPYGYDKTEYKLFNKAEFENWGNVPTYYIVQYLDLETGERLDKPSVSSFSVNTEIKTAPKLRIEEGEDEMPIFAWNEVPGAKGYYIVEDTGYSEERGIDSSLSPVGYTEDTTWKPDSNTHFRTFDPNVTDGEVTVDERTLNKRFAVIAVNEDGTSPLSNFLGNDKLSKIFTYQVEGAISREEEGSTRFVDTIENLPAYQWVTMCDGQLTQKVIHYDIDNAKVKKQQVISSEEDGSNTMMKEENVLSIPYTIYGTDQGDVATIAAYDEDEDTMKGQLQSLQDRQNELKGKAGSRDKSIQTEEDEGDTDNKEDKDNKQEQPDETVTDTGYEVTANTALSDYLAVNMLSGNTAIDLTGFKEAQNQDTLADAWQEAVYQNPLILGANGAYIKGTTLYVSYDEDAATMQKKQEEIMEVVRSAVKENITDGMSDLEKEIALNNYLCDLAEYDMGALENAEKYNYKKVDEEFNDSFTPYGVLVNHIGVCASYAGAFKLLADEAGLDCITVTGYLNGELSHEWNKVLIDGHWEIVDTTNNDNEYLFNALLNLPDNESDKVLVEDDRALVDSYVANYVAEDTSKEYYRINDKYFDTTAIATQLVEGLKENGSVTLRTDYRLDDNTYGIICQEVIAQYGDDKLVGTYWMGVIFITTDTSITSQQ